MSTSAPPPAPWRSSFLSHIQDMKPPLCTLGTLHPLKSSPSSIPQFAPRVRTVVMRGFWAELPVNPKNPAELNPAVFETDLPAFTTDARMDKVSELFTTADAAGSVSGPGGPVEAVFWAAESDTQWRLRGHAYVIGPDIDTDAAAPTREAIQRYMRKTGAASSWSWSRELTAHFGNLSPVMRGSFRNPPPGAPLSDKPGDGEGLGQKVEDLQDELARKNFRVVVIVPEEVDLVDLSDSERARRWQYTFEAEDGSWKITELWP